MGAQEKVSACVYESQKESELESDKAVRPLVSSWRFLALVSTSNIKWQVP